MIWDIMERDELTPSDIAILDALREGARTQGYLIDETGYSKQQVHNRLNVLRAAGVVNRLHKKTALYELVNDPRNTHREED